MSLLLVVDNDETVDVFTNELSDDQALDLVAECPPEHCLVVAYNTIGIALKTAPANETLIVNSIKLASMLLFRLQMKEPV